jgi:hypothetical protein
VIAAETASARALLGEVWTGSDTRAEDVGASLAAGAHLRAAAFAVGDAFEDDDLGRRWLAIVTDERDRLASGTARRRELDALADAAMALDHALATVAERLNVPRDALIGRRTLEDVRSWSRAALSHVDRLQRACDVREAEAALAAAGLPDVVADLRDGSLPDAGAPEVVERWILQSWWEALCASNPVFGRFRAEEHEAAIAAFRVLDQEHQRLARQELVARLCDRLPSQDGPGDELGFLRKQFQRQRAHAPVRQLFTQVRGILDRLKPCALMSPLSVAQFLDPSLSSYDVVVFDEASQIPPWDAIGAIARGRPVIIVGDSKQLPPTAFFAHEGGDEEGGFGDEEACATWSRSSTRRSARGCASCGCAGTTAAATSR